MHSQHITGKATMSFLLPPKNTCLSLFYGLHKIHKPDCPLRPIVSGCDGATDHLSAYIIHFIQPLSSNLPSHIKDKTFSQPYWKTSTPPIQFPLGHSWRHILIHRHSTRRRHSSRDSLHGKIEAPTTPKNCSPTRIVPLYSISSTNIAP